MKTETPLSQLDYIADEIEYFKQGQLSDLEIHEVLAKGMEIVGQLDPIVRERYRDRPEALAEWDDIMQEYYALRDEDKKGD